ncbi:MAG: hypothetical protein JXB26_10485 [Candidatus Aminicenantes bacterium]|nr:hypothetical protein [Candidatus Aminicenantes bacterium]
MPQKIDGYSLSRTSLWLGMAFTLLILHQAVFITWTSDDAYISFRYAEHLSSGQGLTFNSGEKVEGYSNFLWVCLLAGFKIIGLSPLLMSKLLSFLFSVFLLVIVFRTVRLFKGSPPAAATAAAVLACSTSLAYYGMSGLETVFYTLLLTLSLYLSQKCLMNFSLKTYVFLFTALIMAAFTRPEGILFPAVAVVYFFARRILEKEGSSFSIIIGVPLAGFLLYGGFLALRLLYFGKLFPNTFYAKPAGTFVSYAGNAFLDNVISGLLSGSFFLFAFFFLVLKKKAVVPCIFPLLLCAGQVLFLSYAGDWMAFGRFLLPILPITLIMTFILASGSVKGPFDHKGRSSRLIAYLVVFFLFAGINIFQTAGAVRSRDVYPYLVMKSTRLRDLGMYLRNHYPKNTLLALRRQGAVPYYSQMQTADILGLTDAGAAQIIYREKDIIQRNKALADYILGRKPGLILLFSSSRLHTGQVLDKKRPSDRLYHIEFIIYQKALLEGYQNVQSIPLGKTEKAHFLRRKRRLP